MSDEAKASTEQTQSTKVLPAKNPKLIEFRKIFFQSLEEGQAKFREEMRQKEAALANKNAPPQQTSQT